MRQVQLLAALAAGSIASIALAQITNPSFELNNSGDRPPTGWTSTAPGGDEANGFVETTGGDLVFFNAAPTQGTKLFAVIAASNSFSTTGPTVPYTIRQTVTLNAPTLELDYQAGWIQESTSAARRFDVVLRSVLDNSPVFTSNVFTVPAGASSSSIAVSTASIDVSAFQGTPYRLSLEFTYAPGFSGPGAGFAVFSVDNLRLVPSPTAAAPLALLGLAGLRRRRH